MHIRVLSILMLFVTLVAGHPVMATEPAPTPAPKPVVLRPHEGPAIQYEIPAGWGGVNKGEMRSYSPKTWGADVFIKLHVDSSEIDPEKQAHWGSSESKTPDHGVIESFADDFDQSSRRIVNVYSPDGKFVACFILTCPSKYYERLKDVFLHMGETVKYVDASST